MGHPEINPPLVDITIRYTAVDGYKAVRRFRSLKDAKAYTHERVGKHPEMGSTYAVSGDGVGKITVEGCTLRDLFPEPPEPVIDSRVADRIDGYDRDDLGESLDY